MSVAPGTTSAMIVAITGVVQDPSTMGVNGTTLTFSQAPPVGTNNISVRYLGIPASGVTTASYRTYTEYTATSGQTTFTVPSYTAGFINIYRNGVLLSITDYTATSGVTVILNTGANLNDVIQVESFYLSSIVNAIPAAPASIIGAYIANNTITAAQIAPGVIVPGTTWQTVQNTSFLAYSSNSYFVNTNTASGNVTATLPSSPSTGNTVTFVDYSRTFSTNNFIIFPNGSKINANSSNVIINTNGAAVSLVYADSNQGWVAYSGFTVSPIGNYSVNYLIAAGGGGAGGGSQYTGGGGGGGLLTSTTSLIPGSSYTVTVGAGGTGGISSGGNGVNGGNSLIQLSGSLALIALGGGGGSYTGQGAGGGSGGGSSTVGTGGLGTSGQGYAGGGGTSGNYGAGGGGGGAGAVGGTAASLASPTDTIGNGGNGAASSISGASVTYAGGGSGGTNTNYTNIGSGGTGGGGNGGGSNGGTGGNGGNGTVNLGGGGGGIGSNNSGSVYTGGSGGSGIVIISYAGAQRGTGGTVTSSGGYTIHTFTSSGTYNA
jgi:hypothetical protein